VLQHGPQANTPGAHVVAAVAVVPHVTAHSAPFAHVALQSPKHFTSQFDVSLHVIVPPSTWTLQLESALHTTVAIAPSLKSQFDIALQVTVLPSPPCPLHIDVSLQVATSSSVVLPSHFAPVVHANVHAESKHSALQSAPEVQLHAVSTQTQPSPVHVGADELSLPHAAAATVSESQTSEPSFIGLRASKASTPVC
jgi:hypothetical protein